MGYYMGDFYRGDYYRGARGDPGFLSFLGGAMKSFGGLIPGVGGVVSGLGEKIAAKAATSGVGKSATAIIKAGGTLALKHPVITGAGAAGIVGAAAGAIAEKEGVFGGKRKCKHINPRTGKCRRRMRATNTKALRRALRRAYAFERIAMKTIKLVHPRKRGRFGGFKKARRSRV
jgi:hypothetical protein